MEDAITDGIRALSGGLRTKLATAILDGLELVDGEGAGPTNHVMQRR